MDTRTVSEELPACDAAPEIAYCASDPVRDAIGRIGRTEDAQFSPDGRRLVLAGVKRNRLLVLDLEMRFDAAPPHVALTDFLEIDSSALDSPHGVLWLDEWTLIVANRDGQIQIFALPAKRPAERRVHLESARTIGADAGPFVTSPGSISVSRLGLDLIELLVCNNYANHVSRHLLDERNGHAVVASEILFHEGLGIPDGIDRSPCGRWIAVSNHDFHNVFVYDANRPLSPASRPDGVLEGISYPHGLKFIDAGRSLLVADAGAPFVHVFARNGGDWAGELQPVRSIRVMDQETFQRGHHNPLEGGPKGMTVTPDGRMMVTSCDEQPVAFFDLQALQVSASPTGARSEEADAAERVRDVLVGYLSSTEARLANAIEVLNRESQLRHEEHQAEVRQILTSRSWRMTAPMRWTKDALTRTDRARRDG